MAFFRNREIKKLIIIFVFLTMAATVTAYVTCGKTAGIIVLVTALCGCAVALTESYIRYRKIASFSDDIDQILGGNYKIKLSDYEEGELAILQNELGKLVERLKEQADGLNADKKFLEDSIADISHQIRTPLTSINLIVTMLGREELSQDKRREMLSELKKLLSHTDWLVVTLLKMSKIDAGTVIFNKDNVDLDTLLHNAVEPVQIPADIRNISINTLYSDNIRFRCDQLWTCEALTNIIKNCMEHTADNGTITIDACDNPLYTEIVIRDNGSGIDKDDLPHIFERFYKGKNSSSQSYGIGLALTRMILAAQNGTVRADNLLDGGAKFTIRIYKGTI